MMSQSLFQVTEIEITYRNPVRPKDRLNVSSPAEAYGILSFSWDYARIGLVEEFKILLMKGNSCIGVSSIASGGAALCPADPKIVFATALKANASSIILAHNHPSGNSRPSDADKAMTQKFYDAGKLLDIAVLDHIILATDNYFSFADEGLMPIGYQKLHPG
ncbi:JAB domain-containing protein [Mucilaginibacter psychrotolerans]|uniref:DNA repair protein n=1 Tax=Mucilaginibacter psychrotolerans TaxID=1524096 RepID=A0A4Y8SHR4_9SPHI|nr:JAB domain-containing protein [Mucilaginibacter psychrotolerans]TFF38057.1 DNA repair protein [Mucilaginibacter psychrotolerans]